MGTSERRAHPTVTETHFGMNCSIGDSRRPDWDKCSRLVMDWKQLSIGKTSDDLVEVVLNEILHGNTVENTREYLPVLSGNEKVSSVNSARTER